GEAVDHRADIWALGCVLYEMLTGRAAFAGGSTAEILTRVLHAEPDWERLPARLPQSVRRVLRLCLEKNPTKRRQSAGDVRIDLESARTEPEADSGLRPRLSRAAIAAWTTTAAVLIAVAIPASVHLRE